MSENTLTMCVEPFDMAETTSALRTLLPPAV